MNRNMAAIPEITYSILFLLAAAYRRSAALVKPHINAKNTITTTT
jgi:hypothetical protein